MNKIEKLKIKLKNFFELLEENAIVYLFLIVTYDTPHFSDQFFSYLKYLINNKYFYIQQNT